LLRFFPDGDWQRPKPGHKGGRWRSLAICLELLGDYEGALLAYPPADAPLRGDALLALGRLAPLLVTPTVAAPWQALWQAYRSHALCLAGRTDEAVRLARSLVPVDVYEWAHAFECLLRADALAGLDLRGLIALTLDDHPFAGLARRRIRLDHHRRTAGATPELEREARELIDAYDRAGLPLERTLARLSHGALLAALSRPDEAAAAVEAALRLARQGRLAVLEVDALRWQARLLAETGQPGAEDAAEQAAQAAQDRGLRGPSRP
jgi:tetratricopeptide (TPR) repeat protein